MTLVVHGPLQETLAGAFLTLAAGGAMLYHYWGYYNGRWDK